MIWCRENQCLFGWYHWGPYNQARAILHSLTMHTKIDLQIAQCAHGVCALQSSSFKWQCIYMYTCINIHIHIHVHVWYTVYIHWFCWARVILHHCPTQCESRTGLVSPVGHYDLSTLSEDSDSGGEQGQALEQHDGPGGEGESAQEEKMVSRASLMSSILKQVI